MGNLRPTPSPYDLKCVAQKTVHWLSNCLDRSTFGDYLMQKWPDTKYIILGIYLNTKYHANSHIQKDRKQVLKPSHYSHDENTQPLSVITAYTCPFMGTHMQRQESSVCYRETTETVNQKAQNKRVPPQQHFPYCAATSRPDETYRGPVWESLATSPSYHCKMLFTKTTLKPCRRQLSDFSFRCRKIQDLNAQTLLTLTIANAGGVIMSCAYVHLIHPSCSLSWKQQPLSLTASQSGVGWQQGNVVPKTACKQGANWSP